MEVEVLEEKFRILGEAVLKSGNSTTKFRSEISRLKEAQEELRRAVDAGEQRFSDFKRSLPDLTMEN
jgi:anti-sigma-K factor RskA